MEVRKRGTDTKLHRRRRRAFERRMISQSTDGPPAIVSEILSVEQDLPLEITSGLDKLVFTGGVSVPQLVAFLEQPRLQLEAARALTNIASGTSEDTRAIIDAGALPVFVKLLSSPSEDVLMQAVWALGNIASHSAEFSDLVLTHGALGPLLAHMTDEAKHSMIRMGAWSLSNFCRGSLDQVRSAVPIIAGLVNSSDHEVCSDACWACSFLSEGTNDKIQGVVESGVYPRLIKLLCSGPSCVGNIVSGDDIQAQMMIDGELLPAMRNFLEGVYEKGIKKEACRILSNITARSHGFIQAVGDAGLLGQLLDQLRNADSDIKLEAAWAISNAISGGNPAQRMYLIGEGCLTLFCDLLISPDPSIIKVCLEGVESILKAGLQLRGGDTDNRVASLIKCANVRDKIENLRRQKKVEIHDKAEEILESYGWVMDGRKAKKA